MKRPRIKNNKVNITEVINELDRRKQAYTIAIKGLMVENDISYQEAKNMLLNRLKNRVLNNLLNN